MDACVLVLTWACVPRRSLGLTLLARKLKDRGRVRVHISHDRESVTVEERARLGSTTARFVLDGQAVETKRHGKTAQVAASWAMLKLVIDSFYGDAQDGVSRRSVETWRLQDLDTCLHEVRVFKDNQLACTCRRVLVRDLSQKQPTFVDAQRFLQSAAGADTDPVGAQTGSTEAVPSSAARHVGTDDGGDEARRPRSVDTSHRRGQRRRRRLTWEQTPAAARRVFVLLAWCVMLGALAVAASYLSAALVPGVLVCGAAEVWMRVHEAPKKASTRHQ